MGLKWLIELALRSKKETREGKTDMNVDSYTSNLYLELLEIKECVIHCEDVALFYVL